MGPEVRNVLEIFLTRVSHSVTSFRFNEGTKSTGYPERSAHNQHTPSQLIPQNKGETQ